MTVAELIARLHAFPPDALVVHAGEAEYVEVEDAGLLRVRPAADAELHWCSHVATQAGSGVVCVALNPHYSDRNELITGTPASKILPKRSGEADAEGSK